MFHLFSSNGEVEEICKDLDIESKWLGNVLQVDTKAPFIHSHPITGEKRFTLSLPFFGPSAVYASYLYLHQLHSNYEFQNKLVILIMSYSAITFRLFTVH